MKVDDAVEAIARFFNDLIGALVPGSVLAIGLIVMHLGPNYFQSLSKLNDGSCISLITAGLLFALGHVLLAVHESVVRPLLKPKEIFNVFDEDEAKKRRSYTWFAELVDTQKSTNQNDWDFRDLRSVALSVSAEAASLGRRFMFISLLCNGIGTALLIIGIDYLICLSFLPELMHSYEQAAPWYAQAILLFFTPLFLFKQGNIFYTRAMTTPFSFAVAKLKFKKEANATTP